MKKAFLCSLVLLFVSLATFSQSTPSKQIYDGSIVLISSVHVIPRATTRAPGKVTRNPVRITQEAYDSYNFDLVNLNNGCRTMLCIVYGTRVGDNWDIFNVGGGPTPQTRMVRIGKYKWEDKFTVPHVEPWAKLAPGEKRTVSFNTSGGDGHDGSDGAGGRSAGGIASM